MGQSVIMACTTVRWQRCLTARLCGLLASVAWGIVGSFVVVKRIGYIAGGIAHTVCVYFLGDVTMI